LAIIDLLWTYKSFRPICFFGLLVVDVVRRGEADMTTLRNILVVGLCALTFLTVGPIPHVVPHISQAQYA
jgi:hypothetical protein